jgi:hypothetical protein
VKKCQLKNLHKGEESTFAKMPVKDQPQPKAESTFANRFYQQKQTPQADPIRRLTLPTIEVKPEHSKGPTFGQLSESPSKSDVGRSRFKHPFLIY